MPDTSELESFLNDKSAKDGDVVEIISEGVIENKEDPATHRKYRVLNLPVRINGKNEVVYSPNTDALPILQKAWGMNSSSWIGKKFSVKIYPKMSFGVTKMAILPVPLEAEKI